MCVWINNVESLPNHRSPPPLVWREYVSNADNAGSHLTRMLGRSVSRFIFKRMTITTTAITIPISITIPKTHIFGNTTTTTTRASKSTPPGTKSAVFFNIVQKAFDPPPPPPRFEHYVANFFDGFLKKCVNVKIRQNNV